MARVLCPLPDRDFDPTEAAVPWHVRTDSDETGAFVVEDRDYVSALAERRVFSPRRC